MADGGCLAWTIVAASFMVSFLQVSLLLFDGNKKGKMRRLLYIQYLHLYFEDKDKCQKNIFLNEVIAGGPLGTLYNRFRALEVKKVKILKKIRDPNSFT